MANFLTMGKRSSYFCPVNRVHIQDNVVEVPQLSSGLRSALKAGWIKQTTQEEFEKYQEAQDQAPEKANSSVTDRKSILMKKTVAEILEQFKWMDPEDLTEAKKQNKVEMVNFLLKIEPDYED